MGPRCSPTVQCSRFDSHDGREQRRTRTGRPASLPHAKSSTRRAKVWAAEGAAAATAGSLSLSRIGVTEPLQALLPCRRCLIAEQHLLLVRVLSWAPPQRCPCPTSQSGIQGSSPTVMPWLQARDGVKTCKRNGGAGRTPRLRARRLVEAHLRPFERRPLFLDPALPLCGDWCGGRGGEAAGGGALRLPKEDVAAQCRQDGGGGAGAARGGGPRREAEEAARKVRRRRARRLAEERNRKEAKAATAAKGDLNTPLRCRRRRGRARYGCAAASRISAVTIKALSAPSWIRLK